MHTHTEKTVTEHLYSYSKCLTLTLLNLFYCQPNECVQHRNKQCINIARHVQLYTIRRPKSRWVGPLVYHTIIQKSIEYLNLNIDLQEVLFEQLSLTQQFNISLISNIAH